MPVALGEKFIDECRCATPYVDHRSVLGHAGLRDEQA